MHQQHFTARHLPTSSEFFSNSLQLLPIKTTANSHDTKITKQIVKKMFKKLPVEPNFAWSESMESEDDKGVWIESSHPTTTWIRGSTFKDFFWNCIIKYFQKNFHFYKTNTCPVCLKFHKAILKADSENFNGIIYNIFFNLETVLLRDSTKNIHKNYHTWRNP